MCANGAGIALRFRREHGFYAEATLISEQNVEIVRAAFGAWNAGEMDALGDLCDPYVIMRGLEGGLEGLTTTVGRGAVMRALGRMRETWDADAAETITDFIDAGDRVVVRFIWRTVGHGPPPNMETSVYTVRKGKVLVMEFFWDHAEALEAVGLSEQDAHAGS